MQIYENSSSQTGLEPMTPCPTSDVNDCECRTSSAKCILSRLGSIYYLEYVLEQCEF